MPKFDFNQPVNCPTCDAPCNVFNFTYNGIKKKGMICLLCGLNTYELPPQGALRLYNLLISQNTNIVEGKIVDHEPCENEKCFYCGAKATHHDKIKKVI